MKLSDTVLLWNDETGVFSVCHIEHVRAYSKNAYPCSHGAVWKDWHKWIKEKWYFPWLILDLVYQYPKLNLNSVIDELRANLDKEDFDAFVRIPSPPFGF